MNVIGCNGLVQEVLFQNNPGTYYRCFRSAIAGQQYNGTFSLSTELVECSSLFDGQCQVPVPVTCTCWQFVKSFDQNGDMIGPIAVYGTLCGGGPGLISIADNNLISYLCFQSITEVYFALSYSSTNQECNSSGECPQPIPPTPYCYQITLQSSQTGSYYTGQYSYINTNGVPVIDANVNALGGGVQYICALGIIPPYYNINSIQWTNNPCDNTSQCPSIPPQPFDCYCFTFTLQQQYGPTAYAQGYRCSDGVVIDLTFPSWFGETQERCLRGVVPGSNFLCTYANSGLECTSNNDNVTYLLIVSVMKLLWTQTTLLMV